MKKADIEEIKKALKKCKALHIGYAKEITEEIELPPKEMVE